MKSINIICKRIALAKLKMRQHKQNFIVIRNLEIEIDDLQQIKQDLEVLEIIWEKRISMEYLWFLYDYYKDFTNGINYMLEKINEHQDETRKLTVEEMTKLKQWLEENE